MKTTLFLSLLIPFPLLYSCQSSSEIAAEKVCSCVVTMQQRQEVEFAVGNDALIGSCLIQNDFLDVENKEFSNAFKLKCPQFEHTLDVYANNMK